MNFEEHYEKACDLAFEEVKKRARAILKKHKNLDEFVMGMGVWTFTTKNANYLDLSTKYLKPIAEIIGEWDDVLRITGNSVRFTAHGEEVDNW